MKRVIVVECIIYVSIRKVWKIGGITPLETALKSKITGLHLLQAPHFVNEQMQTGNFKRKLHDQRERELLDSINDRHWWSRIWTGHWSMTI